jgi:hypothetical protein
VPLLCREAHLARYSNFHASTAQILLIDSLAKPELCVVASPTFERIGLSGPRTGPKCLRQSVGWSERGTCLPGRWGSLLPKNSSLAWFCAPHRNPEIHARRPCSLPHSRRFHLVACSTPPVVGLRLSLVSSRSRFVGSGDYRWRSQGTGECLLSARPHGAYPRPRRETISDEPLIEFVGASSFQEIF